jgi:hypothetical protein
MSKNILIIVNYLLIINLCYKNMNNLKEYCEIVFYLKTSNFRRQFKDK